jgi:ribonuclease-3
VHPLEKQIGYRFKNTALLTEALTHPSVAHERQRKHFDNQRLEFLGDAVLQLVITEHLFERYNEAAEGRLTKRRSRLVSREALKRHALRLDLGQHLHMGRGEELSGGRQRDSSLADAFEALLGAIYLDSDLETVRRFILDEMREDLERIEEEPLDANPKGQLQELLQAISPRSPVYELVSQHGREHEKTFLVRVVWEQQILGEGSGRSKKQAETAAALVALQEKRWVHTTIQQLPNDSV